MDGSNVGCRIRDLHPFLLASRPSSSSFLQFLLPPLIKPRNPRPSVTKYYHFFPPILVIEYKPLSFTTPSELLQHAAGPLGYSPVHPFGSTLLVVECKVNARDHYPNEPKNHLPCQARKTIAKPSQARYLFNIASKHHTSQARTHLQAQTSSAKPSHKPSSKPSQKPSSMPSTKSSRVHSSNKVYAYI
jgi:hypothetical protein